jgi:hypothetical protein
MGPRRVSTTKPPSGVAGQAGGGVALVDLGAGAFGCLGEAVDVPANVQDGAEGVQQGASGSASSTPRPGWTCCCVAWLCFEGEASQGLRPPTRNMFFRHFHTSESQSLSPGILLNVRLSASAVVGPAVPPEPDNSCAPDPVDET